MTITKAGVYEVDAPLLQSAAGDCLFIKAANVTLNLNRQSITGSGGSTGAGVHIARSANNAFVEGTSALISGFLDGIEIDSQNALAENFFAENNSDAGVYLKDARMARVANFAANNNKDGVRVSQGTQNTLQNSNCAGNSRYGIWLLGTSHNLVGSFDVENNAFAGVYAGCWGDGPQNLPCKPAVPASGFNYLFGGLAQGNLAYGLVIDLGDNSNWVANNVSQFNRTGDMFDANADCGKNLWLANVFGKSNEAPPPAGCIR